MIMTTTATAAAIPAGAVFAYAGTYTGDTLAGSGWLLCDGAVLACTEYSALFKAIGTANGGNGSTNFNLPDYRGGFLRAVDATGKDSRDPDADSRQPVTSGGASGNNCGSFEGYATALPKAGVVQVPVPYLPGSHHKAYHAGVKFAVADWDRRDKVVVTSSGGGDPESRPVNLYVDFILQTLNCAAPTLPAGVLVPMTHVSTPGDGWMLCDGRELDTAAYPELFAAIGTSHGGAGPRFNLPDLRGRFPRGRAGTSARDPDAATRGRAATGGSTGNSVGSVQDSATARPNTPFKITLEHLPLDSDTAGNATGHAESVWNEGNETINFSGASSEGWDTETRPVNLAVDWYVKLQSEPSELPAGSIIAVAGSPAPGGPWLLCDGQACSATKYPALFAAIGTLNGGDGASFNVPDCRGRFLRGVDHGAGRDPNANERRAAASGGATGDKPGTVQECATKMPGLAITGTVPHLPNGEHKDTAKGALTGASAAAYNSGNTSFELEGGDKESRPVNISVKYYIKSE